MTALNIEYFNHFFQRGIKAARAAGDISQDDAIEGLRMWQNFVNRRLDEELEAIADQPASHSHILWVLGAGSDTVTTLRLADDGVVLAIFSDTEKHFANQSMELNFDEARMLEKALRAALHARIAAEESK